MKRQFLAVISVVASLVVGGVAEAARPLNQSRPNVIFIMADDLGFGDLGCHDNPILKTPNIDRLASQSLNFRNYHASPYCTPTRASLLTGMYSHRTGARLTTSVRACMYSDMKTIADYFKAGGYSTAICGKWHVGDGPQYAPEDRGFEEVLSIGGGGPGTTRSPWKGTKWDDCLYHNGILKQYKGHVTDVLFTEAVGYLDNRARDKPFFLYLPTFAPHRPFNVPKEWAAPYKQAKGVPIELAYFFGAIGRVDYNVGRLLDYLDDHKLSENTVVVFTSDNGSAAGSDFFNAGHRGKKGSSEEHGHRLPCFLRWPSAGIARKTESEILTAAIDWLPTFIDLCRLDQLDDEHQPDGRSMANYILGKEDDTAWKDRIHIMETPNGGESFGRNRSVIMKGHWRLIDRRNLTNVKTDPMQTKNVIDEHPALANEMRSAYTAYWKDVSRSDAKKQPHYLGERDLLLSITSVANRTGVWQQEHVARGNKAFGIWPVEVTKSGVYEFNCRRWPIDVDAGLTDSIPIPADKGNRLYDLPVYLSSFGKDKNATSVGKALPIAGVILRVNGKEHYIEKNADNNAVIKLPLKKGAGTIQAVFVDENKNRITGVYYLYVSKPRTSP